MKQRLEQVRFGVNYIPSERWWYAWNDFSEESIARDLDAIATLGADHLRIMLVWPYFQPNRAWVSEAHLDRLDRLMELAAERRLDVCPALFTGWLSGWAFRPVFDTGADFYREESMCEPAERFMRACAARMSRHGNFLGFDLGNEMNCCWRTPDTRDGDRWMERFMTLAEELCPDALHVNGVDHQPWFYPETFSAGFLARRQRMIALHGWIEFTGALKRGTHRDRVCTRLVPAMAALARMHAGDMNKPVWLQEFGATAHWLPAGEIPSFLEETVRASVDAGVGRITWWASHDIRPCFQFPEIEYDMGLLTSDNQPKAAGRVFKRLAAELGGSPVAIPVLPALPALPQYQGDRPASAEVTWRWLEDVQALF